jgi:hypothetical protein
MVILTGFRSNCRCWVSLVLRPPEAIADDLRVSGVRRVGRSRWRRDRMRLH